MVKEISESIAKLSIEDNKGDTQEEEVDGHWLETATHKICIPCAKFAKTPEKSKHLAGGNLKNYAVYLKPDGIKWYTDNDRRKRMRDHIRSGTHTSCVETYESDAEKNKTFKIKNEEGCKKVVTNAVFCILNSDSARHFVKLNDKDELRGLLRVWTYY